MDISRLKKVFHDWFKKYKFVVLIVMIGVCFMLIPTKKTEEVTQSTQPQAVAAGDTVTESLTSMLANIHGVGKVKVMLTIEEGERVVYQTDRPSADREDTVIVTDDDRSQNGLIKQVLPPTYRGAIVVCDGADSASVRLAVVDAVSKVTGLDASEISVLKMK